MNSLNKCVHKTLRGDRWERREEIMGWELLHERGIKSPIWQI